MAIGSLPTYEMVNDNGDVVRVDKTLEAIWVKKGYRVVTEKEAVVEAPAEDVSKSKLAKMSRPDLRAKAAEMGVEGSEELNKAALIEAILNGPNS